MSVCCLAKVDISSTAPTRESSDDGHRQVSLFRRVSRVSLPCSLTTCVLCLSSPYMSKHYCAIYFAYGFVILFPFFFLFFSIFFSLVRCLGSQTEQLRAPSAPVAGPPLDLVARSPRGGPPERPGGPKVGRPSEREFPATLTQGNPRLENSTLLGKKSLCLFCSAD